MRHIASLLIASSMIATAGAQQNPQPQPQVPAPAQSVTAQAPAQADPCAPQKPITASNLNKHFHFRLPQKVQIAIDRERQKIGNATGIDITPPSPEELAKKAPKPCTPAPSATTPPPIPARQ